MTARTPGGHEAAPDYHYRRPLTFREMLPAVGIAVGAAAATFYVVRVMLQRTSLVRAADIPTLGARGTITRRPARRADVR